MVLLCGKQAACKYVSGTIDVIGNNQQSPFTHTRTYIHIHIDIYLDEFMGTYAIYGYIIEFYWLIILILQWLTFKF